ncbi:MAG TPA: hypothetical protein PLH60_08305 [Proteiniphilum sp.]|nr:hypothetical protein [Proteiniphilum sp.]HPD85814.1 hypothetical protein [Proteiniphilum sp.]HPJ49249.1 hypothetical protein [Proteiniphilum sp.]HPR20542.1 hypothetical protein [Proteiniphilum sp.]
MGRLIFVIICHLTFFYSFALNLSDTIQSIDPNDPKILLPDLNNLMNQFDQGEMGEMLNQIPGMQEMLGGIQDAGELMQQYNGDSQVLVFDVPTELLQILPEGCRNVGRASCVFYPLFADIKFDTLTGRNDGKGYGFTIILAMYDSESQNEEVRGRTEIETMALEMKLEEIRKGLHPRHGESLSNVKTREWGAGGSYRYVAEWDGTETEMVRYSSYYTGRVGDVYFTLEADGDDISVPEKVADKLASLVGSSLTYQSLKSRIIK